MGRRAQAGSASLVVFTVLTQAAAGACLMRPVLRLAGFEEASTAALLPVALAMLLIGVLAAALHLGRPGPARLVLANLGSSWLSREAALGVAFGGSLAVALAWRWAEPAGAVLGLALVYAIARLYMLRTVPTWNTWATPAAFFGTTLILGAAAGSVELVQIGHEARMLGLATALLAAAVITVTARTHHRSIFAARIAATVLGAGLMVLAAWPSGSGRWIVALCAGALLLVGEMLGRHLFYASHRRVGL